MKYFFARFYDSLKDFPGVQRRLPGYGAIMQLPLLVNQTVKDLAESLGVPHSEIAMILVNSKEVDFDYIIKDKDFVSFFPDFKTFDISGVTKINIEKPKEFKFILDVHLGKLAKYLR
ncbi:twitching motility protein PilT, partial [Bacteroidetes/Chlorobi group bacterium ChocPot_Mid]